MLFAGCVAILAAGSDATASAVAAAPPELRQHAGTGYSFSYLDGWTLKPAEHEDDLAANVESVAVKDAGACSVHVQVVEPGLHPAVMTAVHQKNFASEFFGEKPAKKPFTSWGAFAGDGVELTGPAATGHDATVRIFAHRGAARSFAIIEVCPSDESEGARAGFRQIETSFALH